MVLLDRQIVFKINTAGRKLLTLLRFVRTGEIHSVTAIIPVARKARLSVLDSAAVPLAGKMD
jgi:hypothetical protein